MEREREMGGGGGGGWVKSASCVRKISSYRRNIRTRYLFFNAFISLGCFSLQEN